MNKDHYYMNIYSKPQFYIEYSVIHNNIMLQVQFDGTENLDVVPT